MKQLFESATVKLTVYYLLILMSISILFSYIIFQISSSEVGTRLGVFETRIEGNVNVPSRIDSNFSDFRNRQLHETEISLFIALLYANIAILVLGGVGSYALARWSLKPIEKSHEAQSRFASDASHELRTPLAVMKSELEVALRDSALSKSEMRQLLESNLEEVNRLSDLSHMLLLLSRQEFSKVDTQHIDLKQVINDAVKTHSISRHRIVTSYPKRSVKLEANASSITELFVIILDNALRYSPADSTVKLSVTSRVNTIDIQVENIGVGIPKQDLPHIFERFYRGDKSRTSSNLSTGYGLGLSLAKQIVEIHDGTIEIQSLPEVKTSVIIHFKKLLR